MVTGTGPAFPSGHVLAATALWCLVPAVVALYTCRPDVIGRLAAGWVIVAAVAASRVYLGVHWSNDVAAALLLSPAQLALVAAAARAVGERPRQTVGLT